MAIKEVRWSDRIGNRSRKAHLVLRDRGSLHLFAGESIPGVAALIGRQYQKDGKWSNTTYRLALASSAEVAFQGHSGFETRTVLEALRAGTWTEVASALGVPDSANFRSFFASWRPAEAEEITRREAEVSALA